MRQEQEILNTILWPQNKLNLAGTLIFANTIDFINTTSINISRTNKSLEIFYFSSPLMKPMEQNFFIKMYFKKDIDGYYFDLKKSSPEIKNEDEIDDTLNIIKKAIIKMNVNPIFFPTGVIKHKKPMSQIKNN